MQVSILRVTRTPGLHDLHASGDFRAFDNRIGYGAAVVIPSLSSIRVININVYPGVATLLLVVNGPGDDTIFLRIPRCPLWP